MVQLNLPLRTAEADCPLWEGCTAPLCPLSADKDGAVWFPGEPICRYGAFNALRWVTIQTKIAALRGRKSRGYFTKAMLKAVREVTPGVKGRVDDDAAAKPRDAGPARRARGSKRAAHPASGRATKPATSPRPAKPAGKKNAGSPQSDSRASVRRSGLKR